MKTQRSGGHGMFHLKGEALSGGMARGVAYVYNDILETKQATYDIGKDRVEPEFRRILDARDKVRHQLLDSAKRVGSAMSKDLADIFLAQEGMLSDPQLLEDLEKIIREKLINAERVVELVFQKWSRKFRSSPSQMLNQRADDVEDLYRRMVGVLAGIQAHRLESLPANTILVARRLLPSDTVFLSGDSCVAILLVMAGSTAHATILARELGIPCVGRLPNLLLSVATGNELLVDGNSGVIIANPSAKNIRSFEAEAGRVAARSETAGENRFERAVTKGGKRIQVFANVSSREDVEKAAASGAEGIGLFRTESFFLGAKTLPTTEEFVTYLSRCLEPIKGKPVNLRLLDIGGDKNIPYLSLPFELNPFLGRRGVRLLFEYPPLLHTQLEASLIVSTRHKVRLLVPMVTFPEEMARLRKMIGAMAAKMRIKPPPVGAMIETPAAALSVRALRRHCDFLCVGTNDLTQYVMAADRESALVSAYFRDDSPVIMELLAGIVAQAGSTPVTLCGELAAKPEALARLLRAGLRALSVASLKIPAVKESIRALRRE